MIEFTETYSLPWLVIAAAALIGALCLNNLLAKIGGNVSVLGRSLRWAVVITVAAAFTLPAPVPGADGVYAPAFIVLLFETVFQAQGAPESARRVLLSGLPLTFVGSLLFFALAQLPLRQQRSAESGK